MRRLALVVLMVAASGCAAVSTPENVDSVPAASTSPTPEFEMPEGCVPVDYWDTPAFACPPIP